MLKNIPKALSLKRYIAVSAAILLVLGFTAFFIFRTINMFLFNYIEKESKRQAERYAENLGTAINADNAINSLLNEKIVATSEVLVYYKANFGNEGIDNTFLSQLTAAMAVDAIYKYNGYGVITNSSDGLYIGWQATKGHPVHDFMIGSEQIKVGEIRRDTVSGIYLKYGYVKAGEDGTFFQIGVLAEKIYDLLKSFDFNTLLNNMAGLENVKGAGFIDNDKNIINISDYAVIDLSRFPESDLSALDGGGTYLRPTNDNREYVIITPVYLNEAKIGSLVMYYYVYNTVQVINNINIIEIIAFSLIMVLIVLILNRNKKIVRMAYYEPLTGLPNKRYLSEVLIKEIALPNVNKALILLNCINFRSINLIYGYNYGDTVIKTLSQKIKLICSDNCMLFHLSPDRFGIYVKNYSDKNKLNSICDECIDIYKDTLSNSSSGAAIGVFEFGGFKGESDAVIKYANIAASNVNSLFGYSFFNKSMAAEINKAETIRNELGMALAENSNNIYLHYQPILSLKTGKIFAFEALCRFSSEKTGNVIPSEFIAIAEKNQLITALGIRILNEACGFIKILEENGYDGVKVSVNISVLQMLGESFIRDVSGVLIKNQ